MTDTEQLTITFRRTVLLESEGDHMRMQVTIRCASQQQLEQFIALGVRDNTERTLDNLVRRFAG